MTGGAADRSLSVGATRAGLARRLATLLVALAVPVVIAGVVLGLFFNPLWVGFEQERTGVAAITGFSPADVRAVTGSILWDVVIGPPRFDVRVAGQPVLDAAERAHMVDVHRVLLRVGAVVLLALAVLLALGWRGRRDAWFWRGATWGAGVLAGLVVLVGAVFAVAFDQAFLVFHELFFPGGDFEFDPRTQRLVQIFPEAFWFETVLAIALGGLALAVAVALVARRRAHLLDAGPASRASEGRPGGGPR
ncbi:MAG TPA: DUF1461 domain-containing protein [Candidatus Limnocylindrales bacterium]